MRRRAPGVARAQQAVGGTDKGRRVRPHAAQLRCTAPGARRMVLGLGRDGLKVRAVDGASIYVLGSSVVGGYNRRAAQR